MRLPRTFKSRLLAPLAAGLALSVGTFSATAQDINLNTSCVDGFVEAHDYAELSANFREYGWDSKATLRLVAEDESTTLVVLDVNNAPVCENVASLRTSCTWTLSPGGIYTARVDNQTRATATAYRLCAG